MDEGTKVTIDTLSKELLRVYARSVGTDDWFFRFLSIAVVPFLGFLAYALANAQYRIFIAALPILSLIGSAVVLVLSSHYIFTGAYGNYLERRINVLLRGHELRDEIFGTAVYKGLSSPILLAHVVGFGALIAINIVSVPIINDTIQRFCAIHPKLPYDRSAVLQVYWITVVVSVALFLIGATHCLYRVQRRVAKASAG